MRSGRFYFMKIQASIGLLLILLIPFNFYAQNKDLRNITFYSDVSQSAISAQHRLHADSLLQASVRIYLQKPESRKDFSDDCIWLNVQYTPDSTLRIVSWQLNLNDSLFSYRAFLQNLRSGELFEMQELPVIPKNSVYQTLDAAHWYGGIYYDIKAVQFSNHSAFLLFGFRIVKGKQKEKFCDVLWFDDANQPQFGLPVFQYDEDDIRHRIFIDYDFRARGYMQYDEKKKRILFDHIIEVPSHEGMMRVPDGSYEGFQFDDGMFEYQAKVFHEKIEPKDPFQEYQKSRKN